MEHVRDLLRKQLVTDHDTDLIEWCVFCRIVQRLDPLAFNDACLELVHADFLRHSTPSLVDDGYVQLEQLVNWIWGETETQRANTGCRDTCLDQPVVRKQKSKTFFSKETPMESEPPAIQKRHKSGDLAKIEKVMLHVRTIGGEDLLCLESGDVQGLTVLQLRTQVGRAIGRCVDEIKFIFQFRKLEDKELVEELVICGDSPCEILCVTQELPQFDTEKPALEQLDVLKALLMTTSQEYQTMAACQMRKVLSVERNPPIDEILTLGVVPRLLELSQDRSCPKLQFESLWALTNIASGTNQQTQAVVDLGAVPVLVELLADNDNDDELNEQVVWALGNVAGDSPLLRDLCISSGALPPILKLIDTDTDGSCQRPMSLIQNACWALSNIVRGKPPPCLEVVATALMTLESLLHRENAEILADTCWALSYILDGPNERIHAGIQAGICPQLVNALSHASASVQTPALRAVGNIVTGDNEQTQAILDCNVLPILAQLAAHNKKSIRKEACWTISNILAGSSDQIQAVIDAELIPILLVQLGTDQHDVAKEAAWGISNASSCKLMDKIEHLIACGCVDFVIHLLSKDPQLVQLGLDIIINICSTADEETGEYPFRQLLRSALDLEKLDELGETHMDGEAWTEISQKASSILQDYFA